MLQLAYMLGLSNLTFDSLLSTFHQLFDLIQRIARFVQERRLQGIYEVISQSRTVTLCDAAGEMATIDTLQEVRFRQNHVAVLLDYVWGDGDILADYRCAPGTPVDRHKEGTRHVVVISLRELKSVGDELTFRTHRQVVGGFTRPSECWETEVYHRTQRLDTHIIFPKERRCQRATVCVQSTGQTVALGANAFHQLPDGRQVLRWACAKPKLNERYLLRWEW